MREWVDETRRLVDRLKLFPGEDKDGMESSLLEYLVPLLAAASSEEVPAMDNGIFELRHFWLRYVPWCSTLSKDIEKILILYDEYAESRK